MSELHNPEIEPICKRYLTLRYQLLPYTYTAARQAHDTGLPLMRAVLRSSLAPELLIYANTVIARGTPRVNKPAST